VFELDPNMTTFVPSFSRDPESAYSVRIRSTTILEFFFIGASPFCCLLSQIAETAREQAHAGGGCSFLHATLNLIRT
jgi:hypothetical protein